MVLLDRFMSRLGMSGKAVIPLVSGVACAVPAIMATRNMNSTRERLIAIFVTPLMSCSARLPVFTLLIGMLIERSASFWGIPLQGLLLFCLYLIGLFGALATAYILHAFLPGKTKEGAFIIEIPPYQLPNWKNLWITVYQKSWSFVWEAGKIIFAISVILWFMAGFGPGNDIEMAEKLAKEEAFAKSFDPVSTERLISSKKLEASFAGRAGQWIEPAIAPMGFDWKIGVALISSFAAREVFVGTMSVLYASGDEEEPRKLQEKMKEARHPDSGKPVFTPAAIASLLVFYIFAMQCMSTLAVTYRETGHWKWPLLQLLYMTGLAFLASMMVYQFLS
jgi:ferrous iron transport protein B